MEMEALSRRWLARPHGVLLAAMALELASLALLGRFTTHHEALGTTGAVAAVIALAAGVMAGPAVGVATAFVGGLALAAFVIDRSSVPALIGVLVSTLLWALAAGVAGLLMARLRLRSARQAADQLERQRQLEETSALHERLELGLLPRLSIGGEGVQVRSAYQPGERRLRLGGDFLDVLKKADGRLAVILGDVVGHGPESAALATGLVSAWRGLALANSPLSETVLALHGFVGAASLSDEVFVTACLGILERDARVLSLVCAGHPAPLLAGDPDTTLGVTSGPALGLTEGHTWPVNSVGLPASWTLLFFTDGLIEGRCRGENGLQRYGLPRLLDLLRDRGFVAGHVPDLAALLKAVEESNEGPLPDDVTLLALSRRFVPQG